MGPNQVWLTRSEAGARRWQKHFESTPYQLLIAPVFAITPRAVDLSFTAPDALVLTSENAAFALKDRVTQWARVPVFVVGESTKEAIKALGFERIFCAEGDVRALLALIIKALKPAQTCLYLSGADIAAPLDTWLSESGFLVKRLVVYETQALIPKFDPTPISHVIIQSKRTAERVAHLLLTQFVQKDWKCVYFLCQSEAIATHFQQIMLSLTEKLPIDPLKVIFSSSPKPEGVLKLLLP